jgi:cytochrome c2
MIRFALAVTLLAPPSITMANESMIRDITQERVDEKALVDAIASRTLSWLTGISANNDYMSVGRMANYFGFVGLRVASGHSLSRSQVATQTLSMLDSRQRDLLIALVEQQKVPLNQVEKSRFAMNRALEGLLIGERVSEQEFLALGQTYGEHEAQLGKMIAQAFGQIIQTLTLEQKQQLDTIRDAHLNGKGQTLALSTTNPKIKLNKDDKKELTNLAARLLSWSTGNQVFNDFEVVGKPSQHFGFVSLRLASNHGIKRGQVSKEVMALLSQDQRNSLQQSATSNIAEFNHFIEQRSHLMRSLEVAQQGLLIENEKVIRYGRDVGKIEASMTWNQAMAMLKVRSSLTDAQSQSLLSLRNKYTAGDDQSLAKNGAERGRQLYSQCTLCHANHSTIAPSLVSIVGRNIAADGRFNAYSQAMVDFAQGNQVWTEPLLKQFIASPKSLIPGTYMGFTGLKNTQDQQALVDYLRSLN